MSDVEQQIQDTTELKVSIIRTYERGGFFSDDGKDFYLTRCYVCHPSYGRENWAMAVAGGMCCWCGFDANLPENRAIREEGLI